MSVTLYVQQNKYIYTGLEQLKGEGDGFLFWVNYPFNVMAFVNHFAQHRKMIPF